MCLDWLVYLGWVGFVNAMLRVCLVDVMGCLIVLVSCGGRLLSLNCYLLIDLVWLCYSVCLLVAGLGDLDARLLIVFDCGAYL